MGVGILISFVAAAVFLLMRSGRGSREWEISRNTAPVFFYDRFPRATDQASETLLKRLLSDYHDPADGLFFDFLGNGKGVLYQLNAFGKPFDFHVNGSTKTAAFNAWVGITAATALAAKSGVVHRSLLEDLAGSMRQRFWQDDEQSYDILGDGKQYDAINDALVGAFYLYLAQRVGHAPYLDWGRDGIEAVMRRINDGGRIACCEIAGRPYPEMYSRHGLIPAVLAYAFQLTGEERYARSAVAVADLFLKEFWTGTYFRDWISIGTDSEIGMGMLEVFAMTGREKYLHAVETLVEHYHNPHGEIAHDPGDHNDVRHDQHVNSVVDQAEFIILLRNLAQITGRREVRLLADQRAAQLSACYNEHLHLYPHMCFAGPRREGDYFSAINALAYLSLSGGL